MPTIEFKIFLYILIVFSAVFHEYFHAWAAYYLGDPTAKYAGRLTLNPLKHLDPMGTVILPLLLLLFFNMFVGMAKPVPYNPYNLRDRKFGEVKVGLAGPGANFLIAIIFGLLLRFFPDYFSGFFFVTLTWVVYINIFLGLFNLLPVPPLDGSKLLIHFFPNSQALRFLEQSFFGIFLAVAFAFIFLAPAASLIYYFFTGRYFAGVFF